MTLTPVRPPLPAGRKNGRLAWIDNLPVVILRDVWDVYDYGARHGQAAATNAGYIQEAIDDAVAAGAPITTAIDGDFTDVVRHATPAGVVSTPSLSAWSHVASGLYLATITPAVEGVYQGAILYNGTPDQTFAISESVSADVVAEITTATITTVDPVAGAGDVTLYQADSYDADESRALEWTTSSAATWPTLTGATVAFISRHTTQTSRTLSAAGSVVVATGASKQVRVELAPADTNSRPSGGYTYQLIATLTNNHVVTLAAGDLTLTERLRA